MDIKICSTVSDVNEAYNVRDRATWDPDKGTTWADVSINKKIYVIFDDREDKIEVIDNMKDLVVRHFTSHEFQLFIENIMLEAAKILYPNGESK